MTISIMHGANSFLSIMLVVSMANEESFYPNFRLTQKLSELGLPNDKQNLSAMKSILALCLNSSIIANLNDADEVAEMLIYFSEKSLIALPVK